MLCGNPSCKHNNAITPHPCGVLLVKALGITLCPPCFILHISGNLIISNTTITPNHKFQFAQLADKTQ